MRNGRWFGRGLALAGALVACASASGATAPSPAWTTWGNSTERLGDAASDPSAVTRSFVLPLGGRITGQVLYDGGSFFAATSSGEIVSFTASGVVRWKVEVGQISSKCAQLDGYGVTGTGVVDPAANILYEMDAFGRLHALSLTTGAEQPGWPVQVFTDTRSELDWGALTLADGAIYVPTASYCDTAGTPGAVYRVDASTRSVAQWLAVPLSAGGGGGDWGWGGLAFDPDINMLFAATSGAFDGGTNTGGAFTEFTGYGDQLVELTPNLTVATGSHPSDLPDRQDLDFVGSPVVFDRPGCGELVAAVDKDDTVYLWQASALASGPIAEVPIQQYDIGDPMLAQLAWSPSLDSLYTATGTQLVRIAVTARCGASISWRTPLGTHTENGSPTISGNTVWIAVNGKPTLSGYNATSGKRMFQTPLGGTTLTAPTIIDGRLVIGTFTGLVEGFAFGKPATRSLTSARAPAAAVSAVSWSSASDAWEARDTGVFATENAGRTWHEIYDEPALSVLRMSSSAGVIELGVAPGPCMCVTRKLWTNDDGGTWHVTDAIGSDYVGSAGNLYWWSGGALRVIADFPPANDEKPLDAKLAVSLPDGTIVGAAQTGSGFAFLVSNRVDGRHWDTDPRVVLADGTAVQTIRLPSAPAGEILAESISADGNSLTVTGEDFGADPVAAVQWSSVDGGQTWTLDS